MYFKMLVLFFIFHHKEVQCWRNYRITLRSAELAYLAKGYILDDYVYKIKKTNRTYSAVLLNFTLITVMENANLTLQFYQHVSNRYKEYFPQMTIDYCTMINPNAGSKQSGFADNFFTKLKEQIIDLLFIKGHKLPMSCPVAKGNYYGELHVDEAKLPSYVLPTGRGSNISKLIKKSEIQIKSLGAGKFENIHIKDQPNIYTSCPFMIGPFDYCCFAH
ncbi:uncharacterized protein LOC113373791 [Ctenocephalides felis]|uniref:uncharacterized protein LOC113373791 n=1 Tax=Ctenocephalides felis TaxID=7515 RepID=UPI000E6E1662|nr:uncharacterized protein LOC113373791 [Ctenocephalides felis]